MRVHGMVATNRMITSWSDESGRGLAALHNLADNRGGLEPRVSVMECGQSSGFSQVRWQADSFGANETTT